MHARRFLVLLVCFTVFFTAVLAKGYFSSDKRMQNPIAFSTMMRYGRSSDSRSNSDKNEPVNVYPRKDSFFLGTRYGKRSTWSPSSSLVYPVSVPLCGQNEDLSCTWVGLSNLYRCTARIYQNSGIFYLKFLIVTFVMLIIKITSTPRGRIYW